MTDKSHSHKPGDKPTDDKGQKPQPPEGQDKTKTENPAPAAEAGSPRRLDKAHANAGDATSTQAGNTSAVRLEAYPSDWNGPANVMLSAIRGEEVPFSQKVHAAYQLAGVALAVMVPDVDAVQASARKGAGVKGQDSAGCGPYEPQALPYVSDEEGCNCLEKLAKNKGTRAGAGDKADGILTGPLAAMLLSFAWKKLEEWLSKK